LEGLSEGARIRVRNVSATVGAVVLLAGCGSDSSYKNNPRPPAPITVTASISDKAVSVSPSRFGAGPVTLVVTNQTTRSRELVLASSQEAGSGKTGLAGQGSGPINPQGTASLKADLRQGTYQVRVKGATVRPATLSVGRPRRSAQNELLQP
jgi:hypothetical protein